ncbi:MAG: RNA polymerase sigma factor [Thermomicrobiales bacterium]
MVGKPWETDLAVYDDEAALLAGLQRRDRLACTCLLQRYAPRLYRLALRLTGNSDEAEEVLQESFIRACAHVAEFEARSSLDTWLYRIVLNTALARFRRARPETVPLETTASGDAPGPAATLADPGPPPEGAALTAELRETVEQALLGLPDTLRVAFVLRDLEGLSTREAATALGIAEPALKVRLHRARLALRAALTPYLQTPAAPTVAPPLEPERERRLLNVLTTLSPPATR